jgi:hypothetical protein
MFVGMLSQVEDDRVCIVDGDIGPVWLPLAEVRKATVEYEFPSPGIKRKGVQR